MAVELDKSEQRVADLLKLGGAEIPETDTRAEEEARSAARKAAKLVQRHSYNVINLKEYDAWWKSKLKELGGGGGSDELLRSQIESLKGELYNARAAAQADIRAMGGMVTQAQQKEQAARRQVQECQKSSEQSARELADLRARSADKRELARAQNHIEALEKDLQAAKQDVIACSSFLRKAREAESEARHAADETKKQIEACSSLVTRLKSEAPAPGVTTEPQLVQLQGQVRDLTFKVESAQAVARACEGLRSEEAALYEKRRANSNMSMSNDFTYTVVAGLLAGGVVTVVAGVILRKLTEPDEPPVPLPAPALPKPATRPATVARRPAGRVSGT